MIFGGRWNTQNKTCPGVYINFVSDKSKSKSISDSDSSSNATIFQYIVLADKNGVLLKSADGFYLTVKEI